MKIIKPEEIKIIIQDEHAIRICFKDGKELDIGIEWVALREEVKTMERHNLITNVLGQIRKDVFCNKDLTAIAEQSNKYKSY